MVRPSQAALGSKRDFQGELSSSSRPVAKAKGPTPIQVSLRYTPRFPRSQHLYRFSEANGPEEKHTLAFNEVEDKSKVRVLILDWHQVVDRGKEGTTYSFVSQCIEAADKFGKYLFVGILSYIDTDKRAASTLGYIRNTEHFAQVYFTGVSLYEKIVVVPRGSALVLQISSSRQGSTSLHSSSLTTVQTFLMSSAITCLRFVLHTLSCPGSQLRLIISRELSSWRTVCHMSKSG